MSDTTSSLAVIKRPADTSSSAAKAREYSLRIVLGLGAWSVLVGLGSAALAIHLDQKNLERSLVMRPPVVVIDTMDWIQNGGSGHTLAERYQNGAARMKATVEQLQKHGALVFDSSVLHTYPQTVRLDATHPEPNK